MEEKVLLLKEHGNEYFKNNDYAEALNSYDEALKLCNNESLIMNLHNNCAMCLIKLNKFKEALVHANTALKYNPQDVKALYRRCICYSNLKDYENAYKDAKILFENGQKFVYPLYNDLKIKIIELSNNKSSAGALQNLMNIVQNEGLSFEDKKNAFEKILALAHEGFGPDMLLKFDGIQFLKPFLFDKHFYKIILNIYREICVDRTKALLVFNNISVPNLLNNMPKYCDDDNNALYLLLTKMFTKIISDPKHSFSQEMFSVVNECFNQVLSNLQNPKSSPSVINTCLNLIIRLAGRENGLGWSETLVTKLNALPILLKCAANPKFYDDALIDNSQPSLVALALNTLWNDMNNDTLREEYRKIAAKYIEDLLAENNRASNIEVIKAILALLQGPFYIGDTLVGLLNISALMVKMAESDNIDEQIVALDALVLIASSRKRCQGILPNGVPIFKRLYKSPNDNIKIRALMGICKVGSSAGSDSSLVPFEHDSNLKLAEACKRFLIDPKYTESEIGKLAAEALSYLSFNADIKEYVVNDNDILDALFRIAKTESLGPSRIFPLVTLFVNVTNSYDKPSIEPELIELAKQAKQHIPKESPKDSPTYITDRVNKLMNHGIITALIPLISTESNANREALSRIFLACASEVNNRGKLIQQGGSKALLKLALENSEAGIIIATHALAKIYITNNPELSFPGDKYLDLVRPLLKLLHVERTSLQNFEALMALTNIASISHSAKKRILYENGMSDIVNYLYDENPMLRQASTECLCNLMIFPEFRERFSQATDDRVKMVALLIIDTDCLKLQLAAAGTLCSLVEDDNALLKILQINSLMDILRVMLLNENMDMKYRGFYVLRALIFASREFAEKFVTDDLYFALVDATTLKTRTSDSLVTNPLIVQIQEFAIEIMEKCKEYNFVMDRPT